MNISNKILAFICLLLPILSCTDDQIPDEHPSEEIPSSPIHLPMIDLDLQSLSSFSTEGDNWHVAGAVRSHFDKEWHLDTEEGNGILFNEVTDKGIRNAAGDGAHLFTQFEHGDIELEVEFLVPKGSNSGLYFMSRYELQIRDSQNDGELGYDDCGGIYAQWKEPDNYEDIIGGRAPNVDAAKAPGLWQKFKVLFRAPRFDKTGRKTNNALFEYVYLNDFLIHDSVEVSSPTIEAIATDEVATAPLMIQGDHGPMAFRNIRFKIYTEDTVAFSNIRYSLYEGEWDYIPDFSNLTPVKEGTVDDFNDQTELAGQNDHFGIVYTADIGIPQEGAYLFETGIDDGGELYIDDELVITNQGEPGYGTESAIIDLTAGTHNIKLTYYQEIWGSILALNIEGPGMQKRTYLSPDVEAWIKQWSKGSMFVDADQVEMVRGFVDHRDRKYTHTLSIGSPEGIHYSYDTRYNALLNVWRGDFANVSEMWVNRGEEQRLKPMNAALHLHDGIPIAEIKSAKSKFLPVDMFHDPKGYRVDENGRPTYLYSYGEITVEESIAPDGGMLRRSIRFKNQGGSTYHFKIADDEHIDQLENDWWTIGNNYFMNVIEGKESVQIRSIGENAELLYRIPKGNSSLTYKIKW